MYRIHTKSLNYVFISTNGTTNMNIIFLEISKFLKKENEPSGKWSEEDKGKERRILEKRSRFSSESLEKPFWELPLRNCEVAVARVFLPPVRDSLRLLFIVTGGEGIREFAYGLRHWREREREERGDSDLKRQEEERQCNVSLQKVVERWLRSKYLNGITLHVVHLFLSIMRSLFFIFF